MKDFKGNYMRNSISEGIDFTGVDFYEATMRGCIFKDCNFTNAQFNDVILAHCTFARCTFDGTDFTGANMILPRFLGCTFTKAVFTFTTHKDTFIDQCAFKDCWFEDTTMEDIEFVDCKGQIEYGFDDDFTKHIGKPVMFEGYIYTLDGGDGSQLRIRDMNGEAIVKYGSVKRVKSLDGIVRLSGLAYKMSGGLVSAAHESKVGVFGDWYVLDRVLRSNVAVLEENGFDIPAYRIAEDVPFDTVIGLTEDNYMNHIGEQVQGFYGKKGGKNDWTKPETLIGMCEASGMYITKTGDTYFTYEAIRLEVK